MPPKRKLTEKKKYAIPILDTVKTPSKPLIPENLLPSGGIEMREVHDLMDGFLSQEMTDTSPLLTDDLKNSLGIDILGVSGTITMPKIPLLSDNLEFGNSDQLENNSFSSMRTPEISN